MEEIKLRKVIEKDGEVLVTGLPYKKGQHVEVIVQSESPKSPTPLHITAHQLLEAGLTGLWEDRKEIEDSAVYARQLREQAQKRQA
jgi:hypothetical protein